jgi:hypothetical protein
MRHARQELKAMTCDIDLRCTVEGHVLHIDKNTINNNPGDYVGQEPGGLGFRCWAKDRSNGALYQLNVRIMANETVADLYNEKVKV